METIKLSRSIGTNRPKKILTGAIVAAGIFAALLMFWATTLGPGVNPDSIKYLETTKNLLLGNGFLFQGEPMTHLPPGYSILLGAASFFTRGDVVLAARGLAVAFFSLNCVLFILAVRICTQGSLAASIGAALIFLFTAPNLFIHSMALSEASYIAFSLAAFILLAYQVATPTPYLIALIALLTGAASATRYVGVVLFPTVVLVLLIFGDRPLSKKLKDCIAFVILGALPLVFWFAHNLITSESAANRTLVFHPISLQNGLILGAVGGFAAALLVALVGRSRSSFKSPSISKVSSIKHRHRSTLPATTLPMFYSLYVFVYAAFLIFSISFFDAHTPADTRILLPALLPLAIAIISLANAWASGHRIRWYGVLFLLFLFVSANASYAFSKSLTMRSEGTGFTARYWQQTEILPYILEVRGNKKIYSNGPDAILFLTEADATMLPQEVSANTTIENESFATETRQMIEECQAGKALIVYFDEITWRWYLPAVEEVKSIGDLPVLKQFPDGVVYGIRE